MLYFTMKGVSKYHVTFFCPENTYISCSCISGIMGSFLTMNQEWTIQRHWQHWAQYEDKQSEKNTTQKTKM